MAQNLKLTPQDKTFIKLTEDGAKPSSAFKEAFPEHKAVKMWHEAQAGSPERQKAAEYIKQAAKYKLGAKYIQKAVATYQDSMERFSELSVATAIDLVENARSEKVRADLAIEGMRQKVGSPVTKVAVQESKTVILTFGEPPKDELPLPQQQQVIDVAATEVKKAAPNIPPSSIDDLFNPSVEPTEPDTFGSSEGDAQGDTDGS